MSKTIKKPINLIILILLNIMAVSSIRNWSIIGELGLSSLVLIGMAGAFFLIPSTLIIAKLSALRPKTGGLFLWVKEAFGNKWGFLTAWCLWLGNLIWIPMILAVIATNLAYLVHPYKVFDANQTLSFLLIAYWLCILLNSRGIKLSILFSSYGSIIGVLLPAALLILLGIGWMWTHPSSFQSEAEFIPNFSNLNTLSLLVTAVLSFTGLELSSAYGSSVDAPHRTFPKALLVTSIVLFSTMILGTLSFAVVFPKDLASLLTGRLQSLSYFFNAFDLPWLTPVMLILLTFGALANINTWTLAPSRILWVALVHKDLPPFLTKTNHKGVPITLLLTQGILVSLFCIFFMYAQNLKAVFWVLFSLSSQLYLIVYMLLFASALRLRYMRSDPSPSFEKKLTPTKIFFFGLIGFSMSLFCFICNFIPPVQVTNVFFYSTFLTISLIITCTLPFIRFTGKKGESKKEMLSSF